MGQLYRSSAADLAVARRRYRGTSELSRLDDLVGRARYVVYDTERGRGSALDFVRSGYWRRVAERPALLVIAALLMVLPMGVATAWAMRDPVRAVGLLPDQFRQAGESGSSTPGEDLGIPVTNQAAFASAIFTNNIRVSFLAFAGGVLAGLGTVAVLLYNGMVLGVIAGMIIASGNGERFAELVIPHGVLELSCIVVVAAAGLRIGWALVEPGLEPRSGALVTATREAVEVVLGTIPFFVIAGLVEGFVTPRGLGVGGAAIVGVALGASYWVLVWWAGWVRSSQPRALLSPEISADASRA